MIIQRKASEGIDTIIDVIWYVNENHLELERQDDIIIPSGHVHIVYNFADPYFLNEGDGFTRIPDTVLAGQIRNAMNIRYGRHLKQLGLAIHPSALYNLFGKVSGLYTGAIVDCSDFDNMRDFHRAIRCIVNENNDPVTMLDEIESYFEAYEYNELDIELFEDMVKYIEINKGLIHVENMAQKFAYSVSSLERVFKKHIGLTPKVYANILRFRHSVLEEDPQRLFYDQSHFIKNCKKYTNKLPTDLSRSEEISLLNMLGLNEKNYRRLRKHRIER